MEVCKVQEQLKEMVAHYKKIVANVLKLAKSNNFDPENLECQKIDIAQHTNPNNCMSSVVKASVRYTFLIILKEYIEEEEEEYVLIKIYNSRKYSNPVRY